MSTEAWLPCIAVIAAVAASAASASIVDFSREQRPSVQPRSGAFSIWAIVYSLLLASSMWANSDTYPKLAVLSTVCSLLVTSLWSFSAARQWSPTSAILLALSAVLAWIAVAMTPVSRQLASLVVQSAIGLYAGWLTAATAINVALIDARLDSPATLLLTAILGGAVSIMLRRPVPCVSIVWALAWQSEQTGWTVGAIVASLLAAGVSTWRLIET